MKSFLNHKTLTKFNFGIVLYFALLYLLDSFKIDFVLIGVLRELLTIPFLILQVIFLFLSIRFVFKNNAKDFWLNISIFTLAICTTITICSFCITLF